MRTAVCILLMFVSIHSFSQPKYYYPPRGVNWEMKSPEDFGIDVLELEKAVDFALEHEYSGARDLRRAILKGFEREPYHQLLGPTKKRGGPAGLILKDGYIIARWGDTRRVDMTFSVTKSFLSTVAGVALDEGLIASLDEPVIRYVWDGTFDGEHNSKVTWTHLLNQSSDWYGELWDCHDWADRPPREGGIDEWRFRTLHEPGTNYEYNDVRVNVLAYSLLQVWRKPLPGVLKKHVMDPIGASSTWRWFGYENSWTEVDGVRTQSVSGGGHSGGGLFIHAEDQARFGLLFLSEGRWEDEQIISRDWIVKATEGSPANENYGFMWWLNPTGNYRRMSHISKNAYYASGFGGNYILIEPDYNMVMVMRWLDPGSANTFIKMVKDTME